MMYLKYLLSKLIKKMWLPAIKGSNVSKKSKICSGSHFLNSNIDKYSYIGNFCTVVNADIGMFTSVADNCIIGGANHPIEWVSTSPVFHNGRNILKKNLSNHSFQKCSYTTIENDVWIGSNCLIKGGITIRSGAVIGMGSVVTKDVGAYEIWAGNPAKLIRKRFNDDVINKLLNIKWWDYDDRKLRDYADFFSDIDQFLEELYGGEE